MINWLMYNVPKWSDTLYKYHSNCCSIFKVFLFLHQRVNSFLGNVPFRFHRCWIKTKTFGSSVFQSVTWNNWQSNESINFRMLLFSVPSSPSPKESNQGIAKQILSPLLFWFIFVKRFIQINTYKSHLWLYIYKCITAKSINI